jgi:hypothetical protein
MRLRPTLPPTGGGRRGAGCREQREVWARSSGDFCRVREKLGFDLHRWCGSSRELVAGEGLAVLTGDVGQAADGRVTADAGVGPMVVVGV